MIKTFLLGAVGISSSGYVVLASSLDSPLHVAATIASFIIAALTISNLWMTNCKLRRDQRKEKEQPEVEDD